MKKSEYLFPVALEDTIPLDLTEALPLPDTQYIGIGDQVVYERLNDCGAAVMRAFGKVVNVNHAAQSVQLRVTPTLRFWVGVNNVSLAANGTATPAAEAAFVAV